MANFNTHFTVAATASSVLSGTLLAMGVVSPTQGVIAFILGTFGGLLPDVDSAHSTSIKVGFSVLSLLITIILIFINALTYSVIEMILMSVLVFTSIRYGLLDLFRKVSKHRGMFHSVPVALIWGILVAILMHYFFGLNSLISWVYGVMISFGYLIHLTLDETYSVDLRNRRVKKSLGTALKFYKLKTTTDKIQNSLIYASLIGLMFIAPDTSLIIDALFSHEAWLNFIEVLVPYDGRWFLK